MSRVVGAKESIVQTIVDMIEDNEKLSQMTKKDVEELIDILIQSDSERDHRRTRKSITALIEKISNR